MRLRLPSRASTRIAVTFGALFVVTLGPLVALVVYLASGWLETALDDHLLSVADDVASRVWEGQAEPALVLDQFSSPAQFIEVRNGERELVARSSLLDDTPLPATIGLYTRTVPTYTSAAFERGRVRMLMYPVVPEESEEVAGYVTVATPVPTLGAQVRQLLLLISLIGAAVLALSLVATWLVARWLTQPLRDLADTVHRNAASEFPEEISVNPPASEEVVAVAGAIRELTEEQRRRLERERSFFADSSHVLRTPLAVLQGNLDLLESAEGEPERRVAIGQARSALQSIARTVGGLLLLSREEGPITEWQVVDLTALVGELAAAARSAWPRVAFSRDLEPGLEVVGDEHRLREAIEAVIENAGRYTPAGGSVSIRAFADDSNAVVEVADDGIGLSPDEARRATERFFRGYEARLMQPGGSGLGLAITRRVVEDHGGTLSLAPNPAGAGTVATIALPMFR